MSDSNWLSVKEASERLNCSKRQVHYLIERHNLRAYKFSPQLVRIKEKDLEAFIERSQTDAKTPTT